MHELIKSSIEAHGGLDRWAQMRQISATFAPGGIALKQRGQEAFTRRPTRVTIDTRAQKTIFGSFLADGQCAVFEPHRTAVETVEGTVLEELADARGSFARMPAGAPWSAAQLAYFAGYAMWMYLTVPFSLLRGRRVRGNRAPGRSWRNVARVASDFPAIVPSPIPSGQTIYFDSKGLIRRHDYTAEGLRQCAGCALSLRPSGIRRGFIFPTRRCAHPRDIDRTPHKDLHRHLGSAQRHQSSLARVTAQRPRLASHFSPNIPLEVLVVDRRLLGTGLGMFALGTDSFVVAGVLPEIARGFDSQHRRCGADDDRLCRDARDPRADHCGAGIACFAVSACCSGGSRFS